MLVEGGYLHSLKLLMEKAAQTTDATNRTPEGDQAAPARKSWRSGKSLFSLLSGRAKADDRGVEKSKHQSRTPPEGR
jgi:hypothetical protein